MNIQNLLPVMITFGPIWAYLAGLAHWEKNPILKVVLLFLSIAHTTAALILAGLMAGAFRI